jgi:N-acetylglucosamine transport system permease protein
MKRRGEKLFIAAFLAPAVLIYAVFVVLPLIQAFWYSLFDFRGTNLDRMDFVGLKNYERLSQDEIFHRALINNMMLLLGALAVMMVLGLLLAHAAQSDKWWGKALRSIYLFPHIISIVIVGILWSFIFHPTVGLVTSGLKAMGVQDIPIWMGDKNTALPGIGVAFVWYGIGFVIMLLSAGIRGIPQDIQEAAELDGAKSLQKFWSVTWPMIWSVRRIVVIHTIIQALNTFALVRLMSNGGPSRASEVTLTYLYERGFEGNSFYGEATAIAVVNFVLVMILSGIVMLIFRKDPSGRTA